MNRKKLFSRIAGLAVLSAILGTTVIPRELCAASEADSVQVPGKVPEAVTEEAPEATGRIYHVDSETEVSEAERDGSKEKPFKMLAEVNDITLNPGDGISLKRGSVFWDQKLAPKGKGTEEMPVVINAYGEGSRPIIHAGGFRKEGDEYQGNKEAVLIENMEYVWVTGLEVTNDDDFDTNWRTETRGREEDLANPRRLGIHVTIDERSEDTYKTKKDDEASRAYKGIVIDDCYIHDVDGNEERRQNKVDGGIGVEVISDSRKGVFPYFDGVTIQNNRIDHVDRTGIKLVRISDLKNFSFPEDRNCDVDYTDSSNNDGSRYSGIRVYDQAARNVRVVGNYVSDVGGDGILICESKGALVEHNILDGNSMRVSSGNANAGIWQWNSYDTTFRYNESFHGPDYNQDGCSFDSDYWSAGTIFEYNYSHDVPMGFMLLMGWNDTDIIRYNLSQNDGVAWRHGAAGSMSPSYIYNNVFYYDGANWLYNHSNGNGVAMGNTQNWEMYNNIYYNYNPDSVSRWSSKEGREASEADWSNNKLGGNLVYEAGGVHSTGEIPGALQAGGEDRIFLNPGKAEDDTVEKDYWNWSTNWESLKAYGLASGSLAKDAGVTVKVKPEATSYYNNIGKWDDKKDRNASADFFGNPLEDGKVDIGIIEMPDDGSEKPDPGAESYAKLTELIQNAENLLNAAQTGTKPGTYPQDAAESFRAAIDAARALGEGEEVEVYENAYTELDKAIEIFRASENKSKYQSYHKDYMVDTEIEYEYDGYESSASGEQKDGALVLTLPANGTNGSQVGGSARDVQAPELTEGVLRVRFASDSFEDQTIFRIGNIRVGYDAGGRNWFYDSSNDYYGWGNFKTDVDVPSINEEHELLIDFKANGDSAYNIGMILDGDMIGELEDLQYKVEPGRFQFESRRNEHKLSIYEVYFTNAPQHMVTVTSGANGSVSQEGIIAVYEETNKTFALRPDAGYEVASVYLNDEKIPVTDNSIIIENPTDDMKLHVEFRAEGSVPVDKAGLMSEADQYHEEDASLYTAETWAVYRMAYEKAQIVLNDITATEDEVAAALASLQAAKAGLVKNAVDKSELEAVLDEIGKLDESDYTKDSWSSLVKLREEAESLLGSEEATGAQIEDMAVRLRQGIEALRKVETETGPGTNPEPDPGSGPAPVPRPEAPSGSNSGNSSVQSSQENGKKAPRTGDTAQIAGLFALMVFAGVSVSGVWRRRHV